MTSSGSLCSDDCVVERPYHAFQQVNDKDGNSTVDELSQEYLSECGIIMRPRSDGKSPDEVEPGCPA